MKFADFFRRNRKKMMKLVLLALLFALAGNIVSRAASHLPSSILPEEKKVIVIGKTNQNIAFWVSVRDGLDTASQEFGVTYEYRSPGDESDIDRQIDLVYQAISEGPDAIILVAADYAKLTDAAKAVRDAGIVLVKLDSDVDEGDAENASCFVATNNIEAGVKAGEQMESLLPEGKKVAVISSKLGAASVGDRDTGVRQGLDPSTEVMTTLDAMGSEDRAFDLASEVLIDPEVGGIIGLNEYSTTGAARAIIAAGLRDKVVLVGFDFSTFLNVCLEQGTLDATVIQRPFNMGYVAMEEAVRLMEGKSVPSFYDTGSILVTKATMYYEENEKLLFPFD